MRPRHQTGQIRKRGSNWILRYYEDRTQGGQIKRIRTTKALAPYKAFCDTRTYQRLWPMPNLERAKAGMRKLGQTLRRKYGIKE